MEVNYNNKTINVELDEDSKVGDEFIHDNVKYKIVNLVWRYPKILFADVITHEEWLKRSTTINIADTYFLISEIEEKLKEHGFTIVKDNDYQDDYCGECKYLIKNKRNGIDFYRCHFYDAAMFSYGDVNIQRLEECNRDGRKDEFKK